MAVPAGKKAAHTACRLNRRDGLEQILCVDLVYMFGYSMEKH